MSETTAAAATSTGRYEALKGFRPEVILLLNTAGEAFPDGGALKQAAMLLYAVEDGTLADDDVNLEGAMIRAREVMLAVLKSPAYMMVALSVAWVILVEAVMVLSVRDGVVTDNEAAQAVQAAIKQAKRLVIVTTRAKKLPGAEVNAPSPDTQQ